MSLSCAQIFVRTEDLPAVEVAVAEALLEWSREVGPLPVNADGVVLPSPERRLVLVPPTGGFVTVIEENGKLDRSLARALAARLGTLVLAAELDGRFLAAELETIEPDGETGTWTAAEQLDGDLMPEYVDAEAELFERLVARGVPAGLFALEWEEILEPNAPVDEGARLLAEAGVEGLEKFVLPFGPRPSVRDPSGGPPVRPDLWVGGEDGEARVIEGRRLVGQWSESAVASLAAVEERQTERILETLAWTTEAPTLAGLTFRYEGVEDEDGFADALERARAQRPRLLAWRSTDWRSARGLVEALREATERLLPAFEIGRECGERVEFRHRDHPNASFFVSLRDLWNEYREEPEALVRLCALLLVRAREEGETPATYDPDRLFPLLLSESAPELHRLAARPFADQVWVALALDSGRCVQPLTRKALREGGAGFDDALDLAVHRLEVATEENDGFVLYEQPEGLTLSAEFPDVSSAARILSPAVVSHLSRQLGDGCLVAIPGRDVLLAAEGTTEARRWLERLVRARFETAEHPLTRMIWSAQNGELVEEGLAAAELVDGQ